MEVIKSNLSTVKGSMASAAQFHALMDFTATGADFNVAVSMVKPAILSVVPVNVILAIMAKIVN